MIVYIRAQNVRDCGEGIYELTLPSVMVAPEHREMLLELFPNTIARAYELMDREALLRALMPAEMVKQEWAEKAKDVAPLYKKGKPFGKTVASSAPKQPYSVCGVCGNTITDAQDHASDCYRHPSPQPRVPEDQD